MEPESFVSPAILAIKHQERIAKEEKIKKTVSNSEEVKYNPGKLPSAKWISKALMNSRYQISNFEGKKSKKLTIHWNSLLVLLGTQFIRNSFELQKENRTIRGEKSQLRDSFDTELEKLFWVTYRTFTRPLFSNKKKFTDDSGWGCTLRVGQMMLINTLRRHFDINSKSDIDILEEIQEDREEAHFNIQKFCEIGQKFGKSPGDWFSPSTVANIIVELLQENPVENLVCQIFMDRIIYEEEVHKVASKYKSEELELICLCEKEETDLTEEDICLECGKNCLSLEWKNSVLIFLPVMLGMNKIEPEFCHFIQLMLKQENSVGIIGGKPRSALYFVGFNDMKLIALDPHFLQKACESRMELEFSSRSYHCRKSNVVDMLKADSSMVFGCYFNNFEEFRKFVADLKDNEDVVRGVILVKDRVPLYLKDEYDCPSNGDSDEDFILL